MARRRRKAASDIEAFAHGQPDAYLECRVNQGHHHYVDTGRVKHRKAQHVYEQQQRCDSCGKPRLRLIVDNSMPFPGEIIDIKDSQYPKGYLAVGMGRLDRRQRGVLRVEVMRRKSGEVLGVEIPEEE